MIKSWSDKYQKLQQLGQGSSGLIFKVLRKDTKQVMAAKIISTQSDHTQLQSIELEIKIMTTCQHPNIVRCHGVELFQNQVWILMEYCTGGSLSDLMRIRKTTFTEQEIQNIINQTLQGLNFLHKKSIIHRDIKASNLLSLNGVVKIADFGVSIQNQGNPNESKFSRIGSPFWMSPEILSQAIYSNKTDIWALGITAIELAQGQPPYSHQHPFRAIYSIQTHPPQGLKQPQHWSKSFNNFVKTCLTLDHKSRPSADQLLRHPFIDRPVSKFLNEGSPDYAQVEEGSCEENTIIMHEEIPKSIWQKCSFPQTSQKILEESEEFQNTVVINQNVQSQMLLTSDLKNSLEEKDRSFQQTEAKNKENKFQNSKLGANIKQKESRAKELYRMMEEEVKLVRRKYMEKIRELYVPPTDNKQWNSPVKRLKEKNNNLLSNQHSCHSSQLTKKML